MRSASMPTTVLLTAIHLLVPDRAYAQSSTVQSASVSPARRAVPNEPPRIRTPWTARYANGSISILGGFGVQHEPVGTEGTGDALSLVHSVRFVVARGLVIEPEFSAYYFGFDPRRENTTGVATSSFGVRPGLRIGYAHALDERLAFTAEGGYRVDIRQGYSGSYRISADTAHELVASVGVTLFLSRNLFLEESLQGTVTFHPYGVGAGAGTVTSFGATF